MGTCCKAVSITSETPDGVGVRYAGKNGSMQVK
jgi:hypothetical protein